MTVMLEARRNQGALRGEVSRAVVSSPVPSGGGYVMRVDKIEEGMTPGLGLPRYRLKGKWYTSEKATEHDVYIKEGKIDLRLDVLGSEEYDKFLRGQVSAVDTKKLVTGGLNSGRFRMESVEVVLLSAAEDEDFESEDGGLLVSLYGGKVLVKSSGDKLRGFMLEEPAGGWKVLSLGDSSNLLRNGGGWSSRILVTEGLESRLSHVPKDTAEYLGYRVEDEVGLLVSDLSPIGVYGTDSESEGEVIGGVSISIESGKVVFGSSLIGRYVRLEGGWKMYGGDYTSEWQEYKEYSSSKEKHYVEREIRRRGHSLIYKRKSNKKTIGWSTSRRLGYAELLYIEIPITVRVSFEVKKVRSEGLETFSYFGIYGREPSELEQSEYGLVKSLDGLRWETGVGAYKLLEVGFSVGGLSNGGVSGRKKVRKEWDKVVKKYVREEGDGRADSYFGVTEKLSGLSTTSPYVFGVGLSEEGRLSEDGGFYLGTELLVYGEDYVIEEGAEILGLVSETEGLTEDKRNVRRLVLLNPKYTESGVVKSREGVESIQLKGETLVRSVDSVVLDGVLELEAGWDYDLVLGNRVNLKEVRGSKRVGEKKYGLNSGVTYGLNKFIYTAESVWFSKEMGFGFGFGEVGLEYEDRDLKRYEYYSGEWNMKNVLVTEVFRELKKEIRDLYKEVEVFSEYGSLSDVSKEELRKSEYIEIGEERYKILKDEVEYFGEGELKLKNGWLSVEENYTDWKWSEDGETWVTWDGAQFLDGREMYRVLAPKTLEYSALLNEPELPLDAVVYVKKQLKSYEGLSGAIALEDTDLLSSGEKIVVRYNLVSDNSTVEKVEEEVSFIEVEEVVCSVLGELEVSKPLKHSTVSVVNLQNGESYLGAGFIGSTKVSVSEVEIDGSYRVSYVVGTSKGGEQVIRVTGQINEEYLEVKEGSNELIISTKKEELLSLLYNEGVREGSLLEIGTHLFTVASMTSSSMTFSQRARYGVRVYVSGIEKGSTEAGLRVLVQEVSFDSFMGDPSMVIVGYKKSGNEIEVTRGVLGLVLGEGDLIKLGVEAEAEVYRVTGVRESLGGETLYLKIRGKLSSEDTGFLGLSVFKTIRKIPTEGDKQIRPSQVGTIYGQDGYDLLYCQGFDRDRYDVLKRGVDYQLDTSTGSFVLLGTRQIEVGAQYVLLYSTTLLLRAYVDATGAVVRPRYTVGGVLSERILNETQASRGLYFKSKKQWNSYYFLRPESETVIKNKIEGQESLEVYPEVRGLRWNQEGEGFGDYDAKDLVARNELFKYHELVLNMGSQLGTYKGDGGVLKEFNYWVSQEGAYYGGYDPATGIYHEQWFMGNQRNLVTNEIDDFIRGYKGRWYSLLERHDGKLYPTKMNYVVRLETEVEFENGKKIKKKNRGSITNLGFGDITLVSEIELGHRYGRFKVAGWDKTRGYLYLSAVSLDQFPDLEENGFSADDYFLSNQSEDIYNRYITSGEIVGSYIPDVKTGRFDLFYGGFVEGKSSVALLKSKANPEGFLLYDQERPAVFGPYPDEETGEPTIVQGYERTVVTQIVDGYAVKFRGTPVLLDGTSLWDIVEVGDTILEVAGGAYAEIQGTFIAQGGELDPAQLLSAGPTYDIGLDIGFSKKAGVYYEKKLSSWKDPGFPWKEILNQRQPKDGLFYEGLVEFNNREKDPYITPGMDGEYQRTEDGDEGLPMLYRTGEAKVLKEAIGSISKILHSTAENGVGDQELVYPDELRVSVDVEKPFELAYTQDSNKASYVGYVDESTRGFYNPFECGTVSAVFELNRMYVVGSLGLTVRQIDTTAVGGTTYKYIISSIGALLKNEAFDNDNLYIRLVTPFGSRMTINCSSTTVSVLGLDGDSAVDVVSISVVGTDLEIETDPADGFWFNFLGFNVYFTGSTPFGLETVANNVGFECEVNYRSDLGVITNNLKQFMCVPLLDSFKPASLASTGVSLIMSDDIEANGKKGIEVALTNGVLKRTKFNYGVYSVESIDPVMGFVEVAVEYPSGLPEWSILVGSTVDKDGEIFSEASMSYYHKYALITGAVDKDYSKIKETDVAVLPYGYVAGAYRIKKVVSEEFVGDRRIEFYLPEVTSITETMTGYDLEFSYEKNLGDFYFIQNQYVYFCMDGATLYKAKYVGTPSGNTLSIEGITDEAGVALVGFDVQSLVGKKVTGGFKLEYKGALAQLPFEDLGGLITQGANNFVVLHVNGVYGALVPVKINPLNSAGITVNIKIRRGIYLDPSFTVVNKYTLSERTAQPILNASVVYGGLIGVDLGLPLTINDVSVRRIRRFSDLYTRLSGNFKELYTFYKKHTGISPEGLVFLANRYVLLAKPILTEFEAELLSYIPEYTAPNLYSFTFDRERPKVKVNDVIWIGEGRDYMLKVVSLLDDQKTVYGLIYDVDAPAINTQLPKPNSEITYEQLAEYDEPSGGVLSPIPTYYEIEYRNSIGEFPLEQTFESLMKNAFTEVYSESNGNGVLSDEIVYHTGVSLEELIATYKLTDANGVVTTDSTEALSDLVSNCYLVVDGAGLLPTGEYGRAPEGDYWDSDLNVIIQQLPTGIDDNRGVYSIVGLNATTQLMQVEPVVTLEEYLPAVLGVVGVDAHRLQVSLEPNPQYGDNPRGFSIENYSYRILKRKDHISKDLAEWILFSRERTYSWFEKLDRFETMEVSTWALFEESQYGQVGVNDTISLSNIVLESYEGNIAFDGFSIPLEYKPTIDKLSIHERRMWIGDSKGLSGEGYEGYPEANAFVTTEDLIDSYRDIRNNWIDLRGGLESGTYMRVRGYNW